MQKLIKLGPGWKRKDKNGNTFLSGYMGGDTAIMAFPNGHKQKDNDPDYYFYVTEKIKKDTPKPEQKQQDPLDEALDGDIPF